MCIPGSTNNNYINIFNLMLTEVGRDFFKSQTSFIQGQSVYGVKWPVWECPLKESLAWREILDNSIHPPYNLLLSKSSKDGLPRHFDIKKWSIINFPITGNYNEGPMVFVDDLDNIIEKTDYSKGKFPILFNARNLHAVLPFKEDRVVLSICWLESYDIILEKYHKNQLFKEFKGTYFSYTHLK